MTTELEHVKQEYAEKLRDLTQLQSELWQLERDRDDLEDALDELEERISELGGRSLMRHSQETVSKILSLHEQGIKSRKIAKEVLGSSSKKMEELGG